MMVELCPFFVPSFSRLVSKDFPLTGVWGTLPLPLHPHLTVTPLPQTHSVENDQAARSRLPGSELLNEPPPSAFFSSSKGGALYEQPHVRESCNPETHACLLNFVTDFVDKTCDFYIDLKIIL